MERRLKNIDIRNNVIIPDGSIIDSWKTIAQKSTLGIARDYYKVGDYKRIHLEGTIGSATINQDVYAFILGFDHNFALEGSGITFGLCKDYNTEIDIALVDSYYNGNNTTGNKWFNMSHFGNVNYGGWKRCDLRYDILGSTDVSPYNYGTSPSASRIGYDATPQCATNPVNNTLMSCLPEGLRLVMKPITKYKDNKGNASNVQSNITTLHL